MRGMGTARQAYAKRVVGSPPPGAPATPNAYLLPACIMYSMSHETTTAYPPPVLKSPDLDALIADTETEILGVIRLAQDERTGPLYEMVRYHLGLDDEGGAGTRGKRLRPLLGLLAYESLTGDHRGALPGAAAVELGHNFSLVHDDIEDRDTERRHRATLWTLYGIPQAINTGDTLFTLSRMALHRLTDLGFPD